MDRTRLRSIAATLQVLAAAGGSLRPMIGVTVDALLADGATTFPDRPMTRRIAPPLSLEPAVVGRTMRYPQPRPKATRGRE